MKSRRKAREAVLQALYQCDTLENWSVESYDLYCSSFCKEEPGVIGAEDDAKVTKLREGERENREFARTLAVGVISNLEAVDKQISAASLHWTLARMTRVDRNILRVACYEIIFVQDIPVNVSINEAIEIAKLYGTDDSPMFVNGVLDNIARSVGARMDKVPSTERQRFKIA